MSRTGDRNGVELQIVHVFQVESSICQCTCTSFKEFIQHSPFSPQNLAPQDRNSLSSGSPLTL